MPFINQQLIKENNLKKLYNLVYSNSGISRSTLSKMSKLSKTTVSTLIDELIERKFIIDSGTGESNSIGRKPNCLQVSTNTYFVIIVTLEEKEVKINLVDIAGTVNDEHSIPVKDASFYLTFTKEYIYDYILNQINTNFILGICVVISAMIDLENNQIYSTIIHLSEQENSELVEKLKISFPEFPVVLLNDTACYAYAEKSYTNIEKNNFAFINYSKGIGAVLFLNGKMLGRADGMSTQFGHYSTNPHGKPCNCGNKGCLEVTIGEESIYNKLKEIGGCHTLTLQNNLNFSDIGKACLYGDSAVQKLVHWMAQEFSYALCNLTCLIHPNLIIIGGKGKQLGPVFLEEIRKCIQINGFRRIMDSVDLRYSFLDFDSYLNGAMKYFFDIHFKFTNNLAGKFYIG